MNKKEKIEEILLTDFGCFDDFTVDKLLNLFAVSGRSLMSEFWKESADLIEKYRDGGDERAAQGVVSCRILIDRLMKQLENGG